MVRAPLRHFEDVPSAVDWLRAHGVQRLEVDSRRVRPGDAFIAWPGAAHDARRYVGAALQAGAVACLVDAQGVQLAQDEGLPSEQLAAMPRLKALLGDIASSFEGHPSRSMEVVAFTGTNGKTSSTWWLAQASTLLGRACGLVGTLGVGRPPVPSISVEGRWIPTGLTTPDPVTLHRALSDMKGQGLSACAIEASSIGIAEHRLQGLHIAVAVFTNFTQDHLDYHGTLQAYWQAKRALFDWPTLRAAVVDVDDARGRELAAELAATGWSTGTNGAQGEGRSLWTTSIIDGLGKPARLSARALQQTDAGMAFELLEEGAAPIRVQTAFVGDYNVRNLLGVIAALRALGHERAAILDVLAGLTAVPGRMQRCGPAHGPMAVIDYAHTPDALAKALLAVRPLAQARGGRLWCVFGCGGNRDRSKRPQMGALAEQGADRVVLTSDNPRSESPQAILDDILAGLEEPQAAHVEPDRARAVRTALLQAGPQDVVLVAGKGHEDYQEVAGVRLPSRDEDLVNQGLAAREAALHPPMFSSTEAAAWIGARMDGAACIQRVHTDTRSLRSGDLYVALRGERFDGHDFIAQARAAGAVAVMGEGQGADLVVPDSLKGLQDLAAAWRSRLDLPLIGVTGSNGKTTVTQMTASILREWLGMAAAATQGNLNNHIGVPLTVLSLRGAGELAHRAAVVELGMNHPGEIAQLAVIAQPTVALVNNAQREHQEFMHTVEAVALENGAVLQALPPGGTAVFPASDAHSDLWAALVPPGRRVWRFDARVVDSMDTPFGVQTVLHSGANSGANPGVRNATEGSGQDLVIGTACWRRDHWQLLIESPCGILSTTLHMPGAHNLRNAVAAAACALAAGAPLHAVQRGLASFEPVQGRSRLWAAQRRGQSLALVDDSYNANPDSVRAAIDMLRGMTGPQALVLGDMGEVGQQGPAFHAEIGAFAAQAGLAHFWCAGELCRHAAQAYGPTARHFETVEALIAALGELPDVASMLVKGSRFMRMERVVRALHPAPEAH